MVPLLHPSRVQFFQNFRKKSLSTWEAESRVKFHLHYLQGVYSENCTRYCNLYILTSICIFSILISVNFLRYWQGDFVWQSRASLVCDHFLYSQKPYCVIQGWYCKEKLDAYHNIQPSDDKPGLFSHQKWIKAHVVNR